MAVDPNVFKKFAAAWYGPGAVIGDGKLLEMLIKFFMDFLKGCPLGVRRAHAMVNGGPLQQARARRRVWWEAYDMTGDGEMADKIADAGVTLGQSSSVEEFEDFVKP